MGGPDGMRGYLVQTIFCVLAALQDNTWESVQLEPDFSNFNKTNKVNDKDKVDIVWFYKDNNRTVQQIKSSTNQIRPKQVKDWATELQTAHLGANKYELIVFANSITGKANKSDCGDVAVKYKLLELDELIFASAHLLAKYLECNNNYGYKSGNREEIVDALIGRFAKYSTERKQISRTEFEKLINTWIADYIKESSLNQEEKRVRDIKSIERLFSELDIVSLSSEDGFFNEWINYNENVFVSCQNFRKVFQSDVFYLFDVELNQKIKMFLEEWGKIEALPQRITIKSENHIPKISIDMRDLPYEKVSQIKNALNKAVSKADKNFSELISYIKQKYPEVDLHKTTKLAQDKYVDSKKRTAQ